MKNTSGTAASEEAHRGQRERRHLAQRDLDRDERVAPDCDDGEGQQQVAGREMKFHTGSTKRVPRETQRPMIPRGSRATGANRRVGRTVRGRGKRRPTSRIGEEA